MTKLMISKKQLEICGSHSLLAWVTQVANKPQEVEILFQQTTPQWRQKHNGADSIIIPEFTTMCLCEDILILTALGYVIRIGEYFYDGIEK